MPHSLDLKINPPLQMLISIVLIYVTANTLPVSATLLENQWLLGSIFLSIGLFFNFAGGTSFRLAKTTGNPNRPELAASLVTSGIYRISRNPMYVGLIFLLLAWATWLGSFFSLAIIAAFQQTMTRFQIIPEEKALAHRFNEKFHDYRQQVRRWL
ncbi:MAG: isoprenylcysteine carboxylmethyltransferase family protein [Methyloprofundus sp.]|nr:isoprenylcysteine carboxylmethyltransferase family protein [Methyloprofundus sp.]